MLTGFLTISSASSLRVFAPSREKKVSTNAPINFLNGDRDAFWITPMIPNASRFILDHPDDSKCTSVHFWITPALERRNVAPDAILDSRDDPKLVREDPGDVDLTVS